jgi:hypothetical protein
VRLRFEAHSSQWAYDGYRTDKHDETFDNGRSRWNVHSERDHPLAEGGLSDQAGCHREEQSRSIVGFGQRDTVLAPA